MSLDLSHLRTANTTRARRWHGEQDEWTLGDWGNAMCGEAGEAANVVKKIRRIETGVQTDPTRDHESDLADLRGKLAKELADVVIYADLIAAQIGANLDDAIREKFNEVSVKYGFPERLP